jgi:hypothetical protein
LTPVNSKARTRKRLQALCYPATFPIKALLTMRVLLAICLLVSAPWVFAANPADVKGAVLEVRHAAGYSYLRINTGQGETWAAVSRAAVNKGDQVTLQNVMVMHDFESRSLNKTFPKILFASLAGANGGPGMPAAQSAMGKSRPAADAPVAKAVGANARTVAEIVGQSAKLKDKPVVVRGKVVKYNAGIMGKNWLHLRDGTGSAADGSNDILITSAEKAKVDEIVTVQGVVRTNKDFGAGYVYSVIIEDARLKR